MICPDLPGFGRTAPHPTHLPSYSFKSVATATAQLAAQLGADKIILGGHDWGCAVVYRVALWYPELVSHLFTVCVPYYPPTSVWTTLEERVKKMPSTKYMLDNASDVVEKAIDSPEKIKQFLSGIYGGKNEDGSKDRVWVATKGYDFSALNKVGPSPWIGEVEVEYYVQEYARQGMGPSCELPHLHKNHIYLLEVLLMQTIVNWYRTWHVNYTDELALEPGKRNYTLQPPVLMITATHDDAVLPAFAKRMGENVKHLTLREVPTSHWALWQGAGEVNGIIKEWIEKVVFGKVKNLGVPEGYIASKL